MKLGSHGSFATNTLNVDSSGDHHNPPSTSQVRASSHRVPASSKAPIQPMGDLSFGSVGNYPFPRSTQTTSIGCDTYQKLKPKRIHSSSSNKFTHALPPYHTVGGVLFTTTSNANSHKSFFTAFSAASNESEKFDMSSLSTYCPPAPVSSPVEFTRLAATHKRLKVKHGFGGNPAFLSDSPATRTSSSPDTLISSNPTASTSTSQEIVFDVVPDGTGEGPIRGKLVQLIHELDNLRT